MAFPALQGSITGTNGNVASATPVVNLPSGIQAGELIVVLFRSAVAGAIGWPDATWLEQFDASSDAADDQMALAVRKADGTEGSTITLSSGSGKFAALAWRVSGAQEPENRSPEFSTVATGTNTTPDPTTCTPTGGAKDYMWVWIGGWSGEQTSPPASNPTNYPTVAGASSGTASTVDTNCRVAVAIRSNLNAASEDPGSWTISAAPTGWTAYCMAIHPAVPVDDLLQNARKDDVPRGAEKNKRRKRVFEADPPNLLFSTLAPISAVPRFRGSKDLAKKRKRTPIPQEVGSPILFFLDNPITPIDLEIALRKKRTLHLDEAPNLLTSTLKLTVDIPRFHVIPPSTRKTRTSETDETFNLLETTLAALEIPFFNSFDEELKKKKVSPSEEFSNYALLTHPVIPVPRFHAVPPSTKRKKNDFQDDIPNIISLLTSESVPRQIVQQFAKRRRVEDSFEFSNLVLQETPVLTEPFTLNPQVDDTKRSKNNFLDTIPNLLTSTFTSPTATPRQRSSKDLAKKSKKFAELDVIPNLLTSVLFTAPEDPVHFNLAEDQLSKKKTSLEDIAPNLLTSTLGVSYQVRTTLTFYPKKRKKQSLEEIPNLLTSTLFTTPADPIFGSADAETRKRFKPADDVIPNTISLLSIESVPRQIVQQFLKRQKAKLDETVPNLLISTLGIPLEDPKVTVEDWKLIARKQAQLELEFRNNTILLPAPVDGFKPVFRFKLRLVRQINMKLRSKLNLKLLLKKKDISFNKDLGGEL